jgi:ribonuclease HI
MNNFALFTDVSVNPQCRRGIGGYLLIPASHLEAEPEDIGRDEISGRIKFKRFAETSSTRLEVQTILWAVEDARVDLASTSPGSLKIYTDSQCVAGLLGRRVGLIGRDFTAKRSGRQLNNALLYRAFYEEYDRLGFQLIKVGHPRADSHDTVQRIFSQVDRGVRKELRLWLDSHGLIPEPI